MVIDIVGGNGSAGCNNNSVAGNGSRCSVRSSCRVGRGNLSRGNVNLTIFADSEG